MQTVIEMDLSKAVITDIVRIHYVPMDVKDHLTMRNRPYSSLSIAQKGCVVYVRDGVEYETDSTHIVYLPRGSSYEVYCKKPDKCKLLSFNVNMQCEDLSVYSISENEPLLEKFDEMKNLFLLGTPEAHAACMSYIYGILAEMFSCKNAMPETLTNAIRFIDNSFSEHELSCADAAKDAGISEIYLRKLFTKYCGISPKEYILRKRFDKAKELLRASNPYIASIADACGFSCSNHFCKMFKERFGLTPTEYSQSFGYENALM